MKPATWFTLGAILAALSVAAGAFGAHGLKAAVEAGRFSAGQLANFETAARYQMYHAIGLMLLGLLPASRGRASNLAGWLFVAGIALFCGLLYGYVFLLGPMESVARILVRLVPIGGASFIAGWIALAVAARRPYRDEA